jgi:Helix-turn-helix domain
MNDKRRFVTALGKLVRNEREAVGMSESAVDKETGLPDGTVAGVESGEAAVSAWTVRLIADALGADPGLLGPVGRGRGGGRPVTGRHRAGDVRHWYASLPTQLVPTDQVTRSCPRCHGGRMVGFGTQDICPNCGLVAPAELTDERRKSEEELAARLRAGRMRGEGAVG